MFSSQIKRLFSIILGIILLIATGVFGAQIKIFSFEFHLHTELSPDLQKKPKFYPEEPSDSASEPTDEMPQKSTVTLSKELTLSTLLTLSKTELEELQTKNIRFVSQQIDIAELLRINQQEFNQNLYYMAHISSQNAKQTRYLLSSSHDEKHLLAYYLKNSISSLKCYFEVANCIKHICTTGKQDNSFASFKFNNFPNFKQGEFVTTDCQYENIYRRDYEDKTEIEIVFTHCQ